VRTVQYARPPTIQYTVEFKEMLKILFAT
jgi:hypothetical protein